jgi:hypothetical protein
VDLLREGSGDKVGTLTPEELASFDIIVTKNDAKPDPILNTPPRDIFGLLERYSSQFSGVVGLLP